MELQDTVELMNSSDYKDRFTIRIDLRLNTGRQKLDMTN